MIEAGQLVVAREAATELVDAAEAWGTRLLPAMAYQAMGVCSVAERDRSAALVALRAAWSAWRELEAPYESARVRMLMARAHRLVSDGASAEMELKADGWVFAQLGAAPALDRVRRLSSSRPDDRKGRIHDARPHHPGLLGRRIRLRAWRPSRPRGSAMASDLLTAVR
jgi:hypothetical protein